MNGKDTVRTGTSKSADTRGSYKEDWRHPLIRYLHKPDCATDQKTRRCDIPPLSRDDQS
jgi:hypothetical protein